MGMWCLAREEQRLGWKNQNTTLHACFPTGINAGLRGTQGPGACSDFERVTHPHGSVSFCVSTQPGRHTEPTRECTNPGVG